MCCSGLSLLSHRTSGTRSVKDCPCGHQVALQPRLLLGRAPITRGVSRLLCPPSSGHAPVEDSQHRSWSGIEPGLLMTATFSLLIWQRGAAAHQQNEKMKLIQVEFRPAASCVVPTIRSNALNVSPPKSCLGCHPGGQQNAVSGTMLTLTAGSTPDDGLMFQSASSASHGRREREPTSLFVYEPRYFSVTPPLRFVTSVLNVSAFSGAFWLHFTFYGLIKSITARRRGCGSGLSSVTRRGSGHGA